VRPEKFEACTGTEHQSLLSLLYMACWLTQLTAARLDIGTGNAHAGYVSSLDCWYADCQKGAYREQLRTVCT